MLAILHAPVSASPVAASQARKGMAVDPRAVIRVDATARAGLACGIADGAWEARIPTRGHVRVRILCSPGPTRRCRRSPRLSYPPDTVCAGFYAPRGEGKWKTKYAAGVGEVRPLGGEGGWASDDGAPLRKAVDRNLRLAMDAFLKDASGALPRGTGRMVNVKAQWVWWKNPRRGPEIPSETEETLVVIPQVTDDVPFAGVSILDKKSVTVTPSRGSGAPPSPGELLASSEYPYDECLVRRLAIWGIE